MVICGVPALACETFVKDLAEPITIEPLKKFMVIHDLVVDRTGIQENLKKTNIFIGEYQKQDDKEFDHQYSAAKCLKCGLCLEVCPNYGTGEKFYGALFANDCYLVATRNKEKAKNIKETYNAHFGGGCSKALSCMDVCPMNIPTLASIARMNKG